MTDVYFAFVGERIEKDGCGDYLQEGERAMSLMTSFDVGVSGLRVSQQGINTAAHNLSNTKTDGYSRQQNILTDGYYFNYRYTDKSTMQIGLGCTVAEVRQIRDIFLDREVRLETARSEFYNVQYDTTVEIEDVLGELEGVEFQNSLIDLWRTLETFSTNPQNVTNRELFISEAINFLSDAQNVYDTLYDYQINLNMEISKQVLKINSIGEQVAKLNHRIANSEASNLENANDLRDARNQLMDELSKITYYTYNEDSKGKVDIYINGAPLVNGTRNYNMYLDHVKYYDEQGNVTATSQMYDVRWKDNGYDKVYDLEEASSKKKNTDTGTLLGILKARGNIRANYSDIPVKPDKDDPKYIKTDGTFDQHNYEIDLKQFEDDLLHYNNTTGDSVITRTEAQLDLLIHGVATLINDAFCPNIEEKLTGVVGTDAKGQAVTLANGNYKILDVVNCPVGTDDDVTIGTEVFRRREIDRYQVITLDAALYKKDENGNDVLDAKGNKIPLTQEVDKVDADGNLVYDQNGNPEKVHKLYVYNEEDASDPDTLYTLMSMEVNQELISDYALLPIKLNPLRGQAGGYAVDVLDFIKSEWHEDFAVLDPNTQTSYSIGAFYEALVTDLGTRGTTWKSMADNQTVMVEGLENQRQQVMGVSSEEELTSLLQFQHAYNAASRYITVIDAMLDHLINRLGA